MILANFSRPLALNYSSPTISPPRTCLVCIKSNGGGVGFIPLLLDFSFFDFCPLDFFFYLGAFAFYFTLKSVPVGISASPCLSGIDFSFLVFFLSASSLFFLFLLSAIFSSQSLVALFSSLYFLSSSSFFFLSLF
ncbi:hypothetical protein Dimus_008163 [Dionaea muscipula]